MTRFSLLFVTTVFCLSSFVSVVAAQKTAQETQIDSDIAAAFEDLPEIKDPGQPVVLRYKVKRGDEWTYRVDATTEMDTMGMVMNKIDGQEVTIKVEATNEDGFDFSCKIGYVMSEMKTRGGSILIDSANPDKEMADPPFMPLLKIWKVIRESTLECNSSWQGEIADFKPPQDVVDAVNEAGNPYGMRAQDLTSGMLIGFSQLPAEPISVGHQWDMQIIATPFVDDGGGTQVATYLGTTEIDGLKLAAIQIEFELEAEPDEGMVSDLEMQSRTLSLVDLETGRTWRTYIVADVEMVMRIGENEMMQTSKTKSMVQRVDN